MLDEKSRDIVIERLVNYKTDDLLEKAKINYLINKLFDHDYSSCFEIHDCMEEVYKLASGGEYV